MAVKPGTSHPTKKGMVMGKNGRYVAKSTYNKQVKAAKTPAAKPATKPAAPKTQKALPPAGQTAAGKARRYPTPSGSARKAIARGKQVTAAQGTTSSTVRVGQPAGSANRMYGANVVGKAVSRAQRAAAVSKAGKIAGRAAVPLGAAAEVKEMSDRAKRDAERNKKLGRRPFEELRADSRTRASGTTTRSGQGSRSGGRNSNNQPGPNKGPNRVRPTTPYYGPGGASSGSGEGQAQQRKPKPARQNVAPSKPRVKAQTKPPAGKKPAKPQTSGVGPVASGRTYSVQKTGKSVMQQQADELRAMRKGSQERQAADKKKSEASKKKRKYGR